tara:strand:+ start:745 stop:1164 length:420 start_codon:yes stop_codon:yes gene_type:complete
MREQLITFETAKLAKEKGFDIYCEWSYWEGSLTHGVPGYPLALENDKHSDYDRYLSFPRHLAPTQSLLQKWLREVHNIQLCLQPIYGGNKVDGKQIGWLCYTPFQDEDFNKLPSISLSQYTYEEALEKGLQEALKLFKL